VTGFFGGLLVDLVPPAAGDVGLWALVLCIVGYLAGMLRSETRRSVLTVVAAVGGLSALSVVIYTGLAMLFGGAGPTADEAAAVLVGTVLYDLLLAPFVVPAVMGMARRAEPDMSRLPL